MTMINHAKGRKSRRKSNKISIVLRRFLRESIIIQQKKKMFNQKSEPNDIFFFMKRDFIA